MSLRRVQNTTGLLYKVLPGGVKKKVQGILSGTGTTATSSLKKVRTRARSTRCFVGASATVECMMRATM